jgi:hypothetical protein
MRLFFHLAVHEPAQNTIDSVDESHLGASWLDPIAGSLEGAASIGYIPSDVADRAVGQVDHHGVAEGRAVHCFHSDLVVDLAIGPPDGHITDAQGAHEDRNRRRVVPPPELLRRRPGQETVFEAPCITAVLVKYGISLITRRPSSAVRVPMA